MTIKQIPREYYEQKIVAKKQKSVLNKLRKRLALRESEKGQCALKKTCFSLMNFLSNEGYMNISDLNDLVRNLERSIIVVQNSKKKLIIKGSKNKK